jgi:hypothetical protein
MSGTRETGSKIIKGASKHEMEQKRAAEAK